MGSFFWIKRGLVFDVVEYFIIVIVFSFYIEEKRDCDEKGENLDGY